VYVLRKKKGDIIASDGRASGCPYKRHNDLLIRFNRGNKPVEVDLLEFVEMLAMVTRVN